jgi:DNA polymerase-4
MNRLGIHTGADLKAQSLTFLQERFGKAGSYYYSISRGVDDRAVRPDRVRKSVGAENTFERDLWALEEMSAELQPIIDKVWRDCEQAGIRGRTVTLKVKYQDFERAAVEDMSLELLTSLFPVRKGVRLLGVTLSSLNTKDAPVSNQLSLTLPV